jgi:hypothetical protein
MTEYAIVHMPKNTDEPKTKKEAIILGGRIVYNELPLSYATKIRGYLETGAPDDGNYVIVQ